MTPQTTRCADNHLLRRLDDPHTLDHAPMEDRDAKGDVCEWQVAGGAGYENTAKDLLRLAKTRKHGRL